ncbi:MAG: amidohydrolase family protein [Geminicoccaceae bacterium]
MALDAIAQADPASGPHRITHLYMIDPKDRPRFAELGVVADFQIAPSSIGEDYLNFLKSFIGDRAKAILPIRSLFETGALITLSSDWDADDISLLVKLETVLTRPNETVPDLATAIEMMTMNPAKLLQHADRTGSIEVGKFADLVILNKDLFALDYHAIATAEVVATLFQGKAVFDRQGLFPN